MNQHHFLRVGLGALLLAGSGLGPAAAQDCTPYPETFAQDFYRSSYAFYNESPQQVSGLVSPALLRRLQDERACVERHGRCHLQYDPWLGPGDGAIGHPLQFRRQAQDAHGAVVVMSYPASAGAAARSVSLKLRRSEDGACWQLDDFITPPGESLAAILDGAAR